MRDCASNESSWLPFALFSISLSIKHAVTCHSERTAKSTNNTILEPDSILNISRLCRSITDVSLNIAVRTGCYIFAFCSIVSPLPHDHMFYVCITSYYKACHNSVHAVIVLLGSYTAKVLSWLPSFRGNPSFPSRRLNRCTSLDCRLLPCDIPEW